MFSGPPAVKTFGSPDDEYGVRTHAIDLSIIVFLQPPVEPVIAINCVSLPVTHRISPVPFKDLQEADLYSLRRQPPL
jgi:hypothetical protein